MQEQDIELFIPKNTVVNLLVYRLIMPIIISVVTSVAKVILSCTRRGIWSNCPRSRNILGSRNRMLTLALALGRILIGKHEIAQWHKPFTPSVGTINLFGTLYFHCHNVCTKSPRCPNIRPNPNSDDLCPAVEIHIHNSRYSGLALTLGIGQKALTVQEKIGF